MTVILLPGTGQVHDESSRENFEYIESHGLFDSNVPHGVLQYNSLIGAAVGQHAAGLIAAHAFVGGGMKAVNNAGIRGWELQVPQDGSYAWGWEVRTDLQTDGQYSEVYSLINGVVSATVLYSIVNGAATPGFGTHNAHTETNFKAGDFVGCSYEVAFAGTVFQGLDDGIIASLYLRYIGVPATQQF